jgi:hypothetical protein
MKRGNPWVSLYISPSSLEKPLQDGVGVGEEKKVKHKGDY